MRLTSTLFRINRRHIYASSPIVWAQYKCFGNLHVNVYVQCVRDYKEKKIPKPWSPRQTFTQLQTRKLIFTTSKAFLAERNSSSNFSPKKKQQRFLVASKFMIYKAPVCFRLIDPIFVLPAIVENPSTRVEWLSGAARAHQPWTPHASFGRTTLGGFRGVNTNLC